MAMAFDLLIQGGEIVSSEGVHPGDVGILAGRIEAVGALAGQPAAETLDASGLLVFPGLIDTQVHFREPGIEAKEDLESGSRAAICGGVTSVLEMPNTHPPTTNLVALDDKLRRARGRVWCDIGFFVGATSDNAHDLEDLEQRPGTPGMKIFMGASTGSLLVSEEDDLRRVLKAGKRRVAVHAEDEARNQERKTLLSANPHAREHPYLRDAESARIATERILRLSRETGRPVHILHVSSADEPHLIEAAKRDGLDVSAEVTPQHLFFAAPDCYERLGTRAQMNPPIRSEEHRAALWKALAAGLFDMFGSDHAPHTLAEKAHAYPHSPSGMPGVQTMLPVLLTFASRGLLGYNDIVRMACESPASLYGVALKGRIAPGFDADLTLVDPKASRVFERGMVQSKCGWSPYEGETLTGWPVHVLLHGGFAVRDGTLVGMPSGRILDFDWKRAGVAHGR
ncbi:MAG: dihydroorotase [Fimbriimonas ginsengisoli]|uniref:Dihydroorotase n=1 Tax=Fimbriimonas ginsengisoli TaxID=1005039 RepID=A0A931LXF5_FIMGI|nr:dihydroorotase [Fimbriimonas ginsengisoli]